MACGPSGSEPLVLCTDPDPNSDLDPSIDKQQIMENLDFGVLNYSLYLKTYVNVPVLRNIKNVEKITLMYQRTTLCTLHIAVDFLKSQKIAVVWGGGGGGGGCGGG